MKILELKSVPVNGKASVQFIRIDPEDISVTLSEILKAIMDLSWLKNFDAESLARSYEQRAQITIADMRRKIENCDTGKLTKDAGEYVVSELAREAIVSELNYLDIPLAELLGKKISGNPGFDFHSQNNATNTVIFGEAKYVTAHSGYPRAIDQIKAFVDDKKDIADIADLRDFCSADAVKTDMLIQNVADKVDRPRKNSFQPVFLSAEEMQKMFEALRGTKLELPVLVAAFYGLRRGEVVGLKWDAIDFEQGTISVKRTVTSTIIDGKYQEFEQQSAKTKSSLRTLPLIGSFREYFMQVKEAQELNKQVCGNCYNYEYDGFVFVDELGERMRVEYLTNAFPKFLESHGLRRMRFHDLRHSCASLLLANGVPLKHIQEWLGHSDFTTTANIYAHLDYKSKITSAQAMETGLALPEGGDFSSRWGSIGAGENF